MTDTSGKAVDPLAALLARLKNWLPISEFESSMTGYFLGPRSAAELARFRARNGALKKLRDEVTPVLHHVQFIPAEGEIRFELGSNVPDCWLRKNASEEPQGLEVTVAQAREQKLLGDELNEKRVGRVFLGLPDDAPTQVFSERLARQRVMYTTNSALKAIGDVRPVVPLVCGARY